MEWQAYRCYCNKGFMLWEALVACGVLAVMLQWLMSVTLAVIKVEGMRMRQQEAQHWALSMADQLAAGTALSGRVTLTDKLLPSGVACLSDHPPWQVLSIRWQQEHRSGLPECHGGWPSGQQLCLDQKACAW